MRTALLAIAAVATAPLAFAKYVDTFQLRLRNEQWCVQPKAPWDKHSHNGTQLE